MLFIIKLPLINTLEEVTLPHEVVCWQNIDFVFPKRSCGFDHYLCCTRRTCSARLFRTDCDNLCVLWQVRRIGAASKAKPLYVPATYVTEVPIAPMASPQHLVVSSSLNSNLRILPRVSLSPSPSETTYPGQHQGNVWENIWCGLSVQMTV